jgi:hypothetical protein
MVNFNIGDRVIITGTRSGCYGTKCKDCSGIGKGQVLKVISIDYIHLGEMDTTLTLGVQVGEHRCHVDPNDCELHIVKDWRGVIDGKIPSGR